MPKADYVPYSTVSPEMPRGVQERVDIRFPGVEMHNSIGGALAATGQGYETLSRATREVGSAFDNLGQAFTGAGNELWHRAIGLQDVQNQITQTKAEIEFDKYLGDKQVAFNQLQGEAANESTYKAHLKDIEDKQKEMLGKLPNQAVKDAFDKNTSRSVGQAGIHAAEHAAKETRKSFIESSEARVDQYSDQISKTTDIKRTEELAKNIHDEVFGKLAPARGWTLEIAQKNYKEMLTGAYASQAKVMSRTDPTGAIKLLEANKDLIGQPKYDEAMEHVLSNQRVIVSTNIGNDVHDKNPDAPREEKAAEARKKARELSNDPRLEEAAVREVERKDSEHRMNVRQQEERDDITLEGELYGFGNKEGKIPTKVQDLYANEDTRAAWERLQKNPKKANRILQILARSAKGDYPDTPLARTRVWDLQGMAINEPARFRDLDLMQEEIPWSMRSELRKMQLQVIKDGIKLENDPKTSHAINVMRDILPKDLTPAHKDKWNTFTGIVREGLVEAQKRKGFDKPLTEEEIRNLGKTLLEKMPGTGYWPGDWGQSQVYQTMKVVPDHVKAEIRKDFPDISEQAMLEKYQRLKTISEYNKRYSTSGTVKPAEAPAVKAKTPAEQPPKPPPEEKQPEGPQEKRSDYLLRKAGEFRSKMLFEGARKREEEAKGKKQ